MYAKFPFYSIALMYANNLDAPMSILFGDDKFYWVVELQMTEAYLDKGCVLINSTNASAT